MNVLEHDFGRSRSSHAAETVRSSPAQRVSFLVIDDHPVVSFAISHLLMSRPDWVLRDHASSPQQAINAVAANPPDAVLLDLVFPGDSGLEFLAWAHREHPRMVLIVYTVQPEDVYARRCIQVGARGYISKDASVETILHTIDLALSGHTAINGGVLQEGVRAFVRSGNSRALEALSIRELEVLNLLGQGMSNRRIAQTLCRSVKTVESHRYRISRKLGVANGPELVHLALQHRVAAGQMPLVSTTESSHRVEGTC